MSRPLFNRILNAVCDYDNYFVEKFDCFGRQSFTRHQKMAAALRYLAYGASADIWGEYLAMSETTSLICFKKFCKAIVAIFGEQYGRPPTATDVQRISAENTARGFPGMLGSIDCMHWKWKNCPTAWHGSYRGHCHAPTLILEAVASYDTWIWRSFFGMPGSNNDLNVLARSNVFDDLLHGRTPPCNFEINGNQYTMGYYLADGIYPKYATLVKTFKNPTNMKQKLFAQKQESVRKDVERAFGILQARFAFVREPAKLWNEKALSTVMQCCILLHNMIIEDEGRDSTWNCDYDQIAPDAELERDPSQTFQDYLAREVQMNDREMHNRLRNDLVEHIWTMSNNESE